MRPLSKAPSARRFRSATSVVLSGGTSKGAGDVSHRILSRLGEPGILVHGVALKPGKPLCLAKAQGKAIVVLPGFPTSAIFTFHEFVVPLIRSLAGLPPREEESVEAVLPRRIPSELGRMEFVMASLAHGRDAPVAVPLSKGSRLGDGLLGKPTASSRFPPRGPGWRPASRCASRGSARAPAPPTSPSSEATASGSMPSSDAWPSAASGPARSGSAPPGGSPP